MWSVHDIGDAVSLVLGASAILGGIWGGLKWIRASGARVAEKALTEAQDMEDLREDVDDLQKRVGTIENKLWPRL